MLKMLFDITGIDPTKISLDDKETMSIFTGTDALGVTSEQINSEVATYGVPEFGTKFVRNMLIEAKPRTFEELVKISGLAHGTGTWLYNAQDLINEGIIELKDTISTRDDIMIYLIQKGLPIEKAFDIMETVRKGKALKELDKWNEFKEIMKQYDVPNWYIESCEKIKYLFPKAHAVGYVINAFRIAWYKVHKPKAFYAVYFTIRANWSNELKQILVQNEKQLFIDKIQELENKDLNDITMEERNLIYDLQIAIEMYERGIKFLLADLEKSDSTKCLLEEVGIRLPLIVIDKE